MDNNVMKHYMFKPKEGKSRGEKRKGSEIDD